MTQSTAGQNQDERDAVRQLMRLTGNAELRRLLKRYLDGAFERPGVQSALRAALSPAHPVAAAAQHLVRMLTDESLEPPSAEQAGPNLDPKRLRLLVSLLNRGRYVEDAFATFADADWLDDPDFRRAYAAGESIGCWGADVRWRMYTLMRCAEHAILLDGDFVECGVDHGGGSMCVITKVGPERFDGRRFYLFDTYAGLKVEQMDARERELNTVGPTYYAPALDLVRASFAPYDFVRIVPGVVPDTLPQFTGNAVAYLHIDMNVAYPEREALEYFWPLLAPGAPVVFDDYGFPNHARQREVLDETAAKLGRQIMMLPTCQGLMWK